MRSLLTTFVLTLIVSHSLAQQPVGPAAPRVATAQQRAQQPAVQRPTGQHPTGQQAGAQRQIVRPPAAAQRSPFQLNAIEQAFLDNVLDKWEMESAKIKTFSCSFTRFAYNAFSPTPTIHFSEEQGKVSYQKPDKGSFKIESTKQWKGQPVPPGQQAPNPPRGAHVDAPHVIGDHWVSDGKQVYEYRTAAKQLAVTPIPPEMQGEKIVNGPFPFLFGAKADDLKRRYWLRIHPNPDDNVIHLVALPKTSADRVNYKAVELMLDRRTLLPSAMQVHENGGAREVYRFDLQKVSINSRVDRLWSMIFRSPSVPRGWTKVVGNPQSQQAASPGAAGSTRR